MRVTADVPSRSGAVPETGSLAGLWQRRLWVAAAGALLAAVFLALRYRLALTPLLAETYYDEALTGLMALDILHGTPQVFYWGEPYGGAIGDAYPAALGFWLFGPSTLVLRMASAVIAVIWAWSLWFIARRAGAGPFAFLAGLLVAVPPVFLSHAQLSTHGESASLAFGTLALASAAYLVDARASAARTTAWVVLGVASGVSWWSSQIGAMLLVAAALVLAVQPRVFRRPGLYLAIALFFVASGPFWIWNLHHEWATFRHLATWGGSLPSWPLRIKIVAVTLLESLRDYFWDGRAVRLPSWVWVLSWIAIVGVYLPGVLIAVGRVPAWLERARRRESPWQDARDLVAVAFCLTLAAHLLTWFGTSTVLRYAMTFQATLPVLCSLALARLAPVAGVPVAAGLAAALLGFNLYTHVAFVNDGRAAPWRPVDAAIERLEALGIRTCYADGRIAQVVTFESSERILCSDYEGFRNYDFLRAVDGVDNPSSVAIVTHRALRRPHPDVMAQMLAAAGAQYARDDVGDYSIFHSFVEPGPVAAIAPQGWVARASSEPETAHLALDRRVWTRWTAPQRPGQWFEVDLGRLYPISQVALVAAPWLTDAPEGLRVETSADGATWRKAVDVADVLPGLHWWKGHPRVDDSGRVVVRMSPEPTRYLRLVQTDRGEPGALWSIAELFVYQPAAAPFEPPAAAAEAVAAAERQLGHWMDDPAGPNPARSPITYEHRRAQVTWRAVFGEANRALAAASEWEAPHDLYGIALARSGWSEAFDFDIERSAADQSWQEVVRWAEAADARPEEIWRQGRMERWAEALERLGQDEAADAVRRRPAPVPLLPTKIRFGDALDLVGLDLPGEVRAGETATVRFHWRLVQPLRQDYWAFLHVRGPKKALGLNQDRPIGGRSFGTSLWPSGEELRQSVTVRVPAATPPGRYPLRTGVWLPWTGKQLRATTELPIVRRAVVIGYLTVTR
jgi:hypothetical protein